LSGKKKFELRLNDFDIKAGDTLALEEWDPVQNEYTDGRLRKAFLMFSNSKSISCSGLKQG